MTITEDLQFSVLTAPIAATDRRALSQAWFSALYGRHGAAANPRAKTKSAPAVRTPRNASRAPKPIAEKNDPATPSAGSNRKCTERSVPVAAERRSVRSALARKIERRFLDPQRPVHSAVFSIASNSARVQVLLRTPGGRPTFIAICPSNLQREVHEALAQARYALALRGLQVQTQVHASAAC